MVFRALTILLVDDDENFVVLFRLIAERTGRDVRLEVAGDGRQAVAYLTGDSPYTDRRAHPVPDLVVLDLKMPGMNGLEFLAWRQNSPSLRALPVVVLTGSVSEKDQTEAMAKGATRFLTKPSELEQLRNTVVQILDLGTCHQRPD